MERQTRLTINLGGEQVVLRRVEAQEGLSQPFVILLDIIAPLGELHLLPHLGKTAAVAVTQDGEPQRIFDGVIVEGEYLDYTSDGYHYRLTLRPWTHLLAENREFAIYQDKTAVDIIKAVFERSNAGKVEYGNLTRTRASRTYCVQYGESDFAFVSRLMEEEGIYYYYRHERGGHVLVLCEAPTSHSTGKPATLAYNPDTAAVRNTDSGHRTAGPRSDFLQSWHERVATRGQSSVTLRDYNFKQGGVPIEVSKAADGSHPRDAGEFYDYPGYYTSAGRGQPLGDVRLEELRADRAVYWGESQALGLAVGHTVRVAKHLAARFNTSYLIVRSHHVVAAEIHRSGGGGGHSSVSFEAMPANVPFRAPRRTHKPTARGPETAIVTGPRGEEIFTDEYGRVKVRFHWDRADTPGEGSTCWLRVSQTGGLGNLILPRVGHEVIVDFLNGDPDRPIVVGRVFNSLHKPIYGLPANKTRALWRTRTYGESGSYDGAMALDTGAPGVNELRFEDRGGKEEVFLHAERDMNVRVRYEESHHVGYNQEIKIGNDRTEHVLGEEKIDLDKSRATTILNDETLDVKQAIRIKAGTTIDIEAGTRITLKVGDTSITLDPTSIKLDAALSALMKAGLQVDVKGVMTGVKGDAMLTLKGGMTMINT